MRVYAILLLVLASLVAWAAAAPISDNEAQNLCEFVCLGFIGRI